MLKEAKGLAEGGFLSAGKLALVGEKGPELFMSGTSGTVVPNKGLDFMKNASLMTAASAGTGGGGGTTNVTPVVINAPTQSSVANTKVETSIGLNDPFTQLQRAY